MKLFLNLVALLKLIETYVPGYFLKCSNLVVNLRNAVSIQPHEEIACFLFWVKEETNI